MKSALSKNANSSEVNDGWLSQALPMVSLRASPNCDLRPPGMAIDLLVIHGISLPAGKFGGPWVDALFCNTLDHSAHTEFSVLRDLRVSAHVLIRRNGELVQYVPFHLRAWHAGESCFAGRECCNDFSIGVELEGTDNSAYTDNQYQQLGWLAVKLLHYYPDITPARIVGHNDIAPGRKTDPGPAFDWPRLRNIIKRNIISKR